MLRLQIILSRQVSDAFFLYVTVYDVEIVAFFCMNSTWTKILKNSSKGTLKCILSYLKKKVGKTNLQAAEPRLSVLTT